MYEFFHRPMPFPQARINSVLGLQLADGLWHATNRWWLTLDAIYLMTRSRPEGAQKQAVTDSLRRAMTILFAVMNEPAERDSAFYGVAGDRFQFADRAVARDDRVQLHRA